MKGSEIEIMELEVEKETLLVTLEELRKSFDADELSENDYAIARADYETQLEFIENKLVEQKAATEVKLEEKSWEELKDIAKDQGIGLGKGINKETLIEKLKEKEEEKTSKKESSKMTEKAPSKTELKPQKELKTSKKPLYLEIDSSLKSRVETVTTEIPSLKSALRALQTKKQIADSSLDVLKKNKDDGLIDKETYNKMKGKHEAEIRSIPEKIEAITKEISSRETIISKFDELSKVHLEFKNRLNKMEYGQQGIRTELDFMETAKLYIAANLKAYLEGVIEDLGSIEDNERSSGVIYPDEKFIQDKKSAIENERNIMSKVNAKLDNFETLIASLEKGLEDGKVDKKTYHVMKDQYTREASRTQLRLGKLEGRLKMSATEMKNYDKLEESLKACKTFVDITKDSFSRIWLEDDISKNREEIEIKEQQIRTQRSEFNTKLGELEEELRSLFKGTAL